MVLTNPIVSMQLMLPLLLHEEHVLLLLLVSMLVWRDDSRSPRHFGCSRWHGRPQAGELLSCSHKWAADERGAPR